VRRAGGSSGWLDAVAVLARPRRGPVVRGVAAVVLHGTRPARRFLLAALTLREVATRVGMRAPSLYSHFASKHAIDDAMFGQAWLEYDRIAQAAARHLPEEPRAVLRQVASFSFDFAVADLPRHETILTRDTWRHRPRHGP
jgi:AcrR family transcriptional regulator